MFCIFLKVKLKCIFQRRECNQETECMSMSYEESKFFPKIRHPLISKSLFVAISTFDWCIVDAKNDFLYQRLNKYFTYLGHQHHFCPLVWHNVLWCDFNKITKKNKKCLYFYFFFFLSLSHLLRRRYIQTYTL